jgi:hypothetical protein
MFAALGLPVEELHRRRYGPLTDKNLKIGDFRELSGDEVDALRRAGERVVESVQAEPEEHAVTLAAEADVAPAPPLDEPASPPESDGNPAAGQALPPEAESDGPATSLGDMGEPQPEAPADHEEADDGEGPADH